MNRTTPSIVRPEFFELDLEALGTTKTKEQAVGTRYFTPGNFHHRDDDLQLRPPCMTDVCIIFIMLSLKVTVDNANKLIDAMLNLTVFI